MSETVTVGVLLMFGLAGGGLLRVCVYWVRRGGGLTWRGSHCGACGGALAW